jgi:hypothetical protein
MHPEFLYRFLRDFPQMTATAGDELFWRPTLTPPSLLLIRALPPEAIRWVIRHPEAFHLLRAPHPSGGQSASPPEPPSPNPRRRLGEHLRLL